MILIEAVFLGLVSCGGHNATTCSDCPLDSQGDSHSQPATWCSGDCQWVNRRCQPKGLKGV